MRKLSLLLVLVVVSALKAVACTNLIVGKNASADGSTIVSYSADSYGMYGELYHSHAAKYAKGEMVDIYEWDTGKFLGRIPQARQTYNVVGNMNEHQVTIGETTFGGREELADSTALIDYGSLIYLGLQRSRTAREAIKVMTDLVREHGYYSEGESFTIADPNEVWIMEMIGKGPGVRGAVWVAVRIPDDCISAHANQARIHQFDMNDKENCLYSPDVISFAREKGYFNGVNKDFSFADAYCPLDFGGRRFCEARVWSYFNMYTDRGEEFLPYILGETDKPMPLYLKPNRKLSVQDIQHAMRDHYEGTPLDITKDFGAGAYHTPYRLTPLTFEVDGKKYFNERPIATQQTAWVFVAQMREWLPNPIGGVLWFGLDDANTTIFVPFYCGNLMIPKAYTRIPNVSDEITFSWDSAYWIYSWVANMTYPRYDLYIEDLRKCQNRLEQYFFHQQPGIEKQALEAYNRNPADAASWLTIYSNQQADLAMSTWKKMGEWLIVRFNDGTVKDYANPDGFKKTKYGRGHGGNRVGYPLDFAREYIKQTGDRYKMPE